MRRQGIAAVVTIVALVGVVALLARRGGGGGETGGEIPNATSARFFVSDSLGFRLRIPDSPGWSLRDEPPGSPEGAIVTAAHTGEKAVVRVFSHPASPGESLDDVFAARKRVFADVFGIQDLDAVIAKVIHDNSRTLEGREFRQWQAITQPSAGPDGEASTIIFMWLLTLDEQRSLECIGLVRAPLPSSPEQQQESDALLRDVAYVLQSFEIR